MRVWLATMAVCQQARQLWRRVRDAVEGTVYCQEGCNAGAAVSTCPAGSLCVGAGTDTNDRCLKRCSLGSSDCREGYTCSPLAEGDACVPNCYKDVDCNGGTAALSYLCHIYGIASASRTRRRGAPWRDLRQRSEECGSGMLCLFLNNPRMASARRRAAWRRVAAPVGCSCKKLGTDNVCNVESAPRAPAPSAAPVQPRGGLPARARPRVAAGALLRGLRVLSPGLHQSLEGPRCRLHAVRHRRWHASASASAHGRWHGWG